MQFNSWIFLFLFLPVVLFVYFGLNKCRLMKLAIVFLVGASLFFYAYANVAYVVYFILCITINYVLGKLLLVKKKKWILIFGIVINIGSLAILKYYNFFVTTLNSVLKTDYNLIAVFVPLGISFFTFQFIAFIYDCYKDEISELSFLKYMAYATFFPKIIQGPIMLYQDFDEQYSLECANRFNAENFAKGFYALTVGFGKKILIADALGNFVNPAFATEYASYNSTMSFLVMLAYTLQIYFDFSAYTDMARGIGLMFNIDLPRNFDSPYKALSVDSFWKRWHMSLTGFFTKYLYFPLGGSRKGELRTYINILIVFALSGLWHGANYTFIIWGLLHGIAKVVERKWKLHEKLHVVLQWGYTFLFTNVAWLFFRAGTLGQALQIIKNILRCDFSGVNSTSLSTLILPEVNTLLEMIGIDSLSRIYPLLFIVIALLIVLQGKNTDEIIKDFKPTFGKVVFTVVIMSWCILSFGTKITFIYEMF